MGRDMMRIVIITILITLLATLIYAQTGDRPQRRACGAVVESHYNPMTGAAIVRSIDSTGDGYRIVVHPDAMMPLEDVYYCTVDGSECVCSRE
jgi:hypothetical protein